MSNSTPTMRYDVLSKAEIATEKYVARQRALGIEVTDEERAEYLNARLDYLQDLRLERGGDLQ